MSSASADATVPPPQAGLWTTAGSAGYITPGPGAQDVQLTNAVDTPQAGSALYNTPISPSHLHVEFDESIHANDPTNAADGLAFDVLDATGHSSPPPVGGGGGSLGFSPNTGVAVTLTVTQWPRPWGCYPSSNNFVGIADSQSLGCGFIHYLSAAAPIPPLVNATNHLGIDIDWPTQTIKVAINGQQYLSYSGSFSPNTIPSNAYIGFSAGTGTGIESHSIRNVVIQCTGSCGGSGGGGGGSGGGGARCGSIQEQAPGEPYSAVILMDGINSEENESGTFYSVPPGFARPGIPIVTSYCPLNAQGQEQTWPAGLRLNLRRWSEFQVPGPSSSGIGSSAPSTSDACHTSGIGGGGFGTSSCLVEQLADAGAVMLPYSYAGATLRYDLSGPLFTFRAYTGSTTKQAPASSVAQLDTEIRSIHKLWPDTRIVVVGHSYGGMVAEAWWKTVRQGKVDPEGVTQVFALDSPINGHQQCGLARFVVGSDVADEWCYRWDHGAALDQQIISLDGDGSFTAVGTPHDKTYSGAWDNLASQIVYSCSRYPSLTQKEELIKNDTCTPAGSPISFVSSGSVCDARSGNLYGTTGHDLVKVCPPVVELIVQAVGGASAGSQGAVFVLQNVPVGADGIAALTVACPGSRSCQGTAQLGVTCPPYCVGVASAQAVRKAKRPRVVLLGRTRFSIHPGRRGTIRIRLTTHARKLLKNHHNVILAALTINLRGGRHFRAPVTLRATTKPPRRHPRH